MKEKHFFKTYELKPMVFVIIIMRAFVLRSVVVEFRLVNWDVYIDLLSFY